MISRCYYGESKRLYFTFGKANAFNKIKFFWMCCCYWAKVLWQINIAMRIFNDIYDENGKLITEEREYAPLETITDGYSRYLLTLDKLQQRRSGIKHVNLINFMLKNERFI